jgi:hypothetical protein
MSFDELWNGFEVVAKKAEDGEKFSKEVAKFLKKLHEIEEAYSTSLLKLVRNLDLNGESGTTNECWATVKNEYEAVANTHSQFAQKVLAEVHDPFSKQTTEDRKGRALTIANGRKLTKDLLHAQDEMIKERKDYIKMRQMEDKTKEELQKAQQANSSSVPKVQKKLEETTKKADKSDTDYSHSVNNLKAVQDRFYDNEMPAILKQMESHENSRLSQTKDVFNKLVNFAENIGPAVSEAVRRINTKANAVDINNDLRAFVTVNKPSGYPPPRVQYAAYDSTIDQSQYFYVPLGAADKKQPPTSAVSAPSTSAPTPTTSGSKSSGALSFLKKKDKPSKDKAPKEPKASKGGSKESSTAVTVSAPMNSVKNETSANRAPTLTFNTPATPPTTNETNSRPVSAQPTNTPYIPAPTHQSASSVASSNDGQTRLRALYDYDATEANELSMREGDLLVLLEKDESGWWRGRNADGNEGVFPSNFVEVIGGDGEASSEPGNRSTVVVPKEGQTMRCKVLYDYDAEDETELTIKEGEILEIQGEEDGWYYGTNTSGAGGNFPSNYVEVVE